MKQLVAILTVLAVPALAQRQPQPHESAPPQKVQQVDFTGDLIGGDREIPLGTIYAVPQRPTWKSLIKVRMNFDDKLAQSVHEM